MKKVFILLTCSLLLVGCTKEEQNTGNQTIETPEITTTTTTTTTTKKTTTNTTSKPILNAKEMTCTHHQDYGQAGYVIDAVYKINFTGELVNYVDTEETVTSSSNQVLDYFLTTLNTTYSEQNKTYGGYNFSVTKTGNKVVSKAVINYHQMDMAKFVGDNPALSIYIKDNLLTLEGVKAIYAASGIKCPNN